MDISNEQQELNLVSFLHSFFIPAKLTAGKSDWRKLQSTVMQAKLGLLEVILWLHLGARINYFDRQQCEHVLREILPLYTNSESSIEEAEKLIPGELIWFLRKALDRYNIFSPSGEMEDFLDSKFVRPYFQTALMIETTFIQDGIAQSFTSSISFSPEREWSLLMSDPLNSEGLIYTLSYQQDLPVEPTKDVLYAGFCRTLDYMITCLQLFDDLLRSASSSEQEQDAKLLARWIRGMIAWRLNFNVGATKERFLNVASGLEEMMIEEISLQQLQLHYEYYKGGFIALARALMNGWGDSMTLVAGGYSHQ